MEKLIQYINDNSVDNQKEIEKSILNMVCQEDDPIPLSNEILLDALKIQGEFLVLNLDYSNYEEELLSQKIRYKISQSLSVMIRYEDEGNSFENIEKFVHYIASKIDVKQNMRFGVKSVDKLSSFPITILFSGILPINQLRMTVGSTIDKLIHSDDEYFLPRFTKLRETISTEIGVTLLPVLPILDKNLGEFQVRLVDLLDGRLISEFEVCKEFNKDTIEIYLQKLIYIYKVLAQEKAIISH